MPAPYRPRGGHARPRTGVGSGSGGYSRPSGGYTSSYSAPSRRPPVTSSGGYSRRSYSGSGYATGSPGDRAMSRGASSKALRDYRASQRPAETYSRRPSVTGNSDWGAAVDRRPPVWGGRWPGGGRRVKPCRARAYLPGWRCGRRSTPFPRLAGPSTSMTTGTTQGMWNGARRPTVKLHEIRPWLPSSNNSTHGSRRWKASRAIPLRHLPRRAADRRPHRVRRGPALSGRSFLSALPFWCSFGCGGDALPDPVPMRPRRVLAARPRRAFASA